MAYFCLPRRRRLCCSAEPLWSQYKRTKSWCSVAMSQPNSQINSAILLNNKTRPVKWKIGPFSVLCNSQYHDQALISGSVNCKTMHANNIHAVGYENQVNDYIVTSFQIFWEELFCTDFCQFWESKPNIDLHHISHIERNFTILVWLLLVWNSSPFEI